MNFKSIVILAFVTLLVACSEDLKLNASNHGIDPDLFEYFERFKIEAKKRNISIDFQSMNVEGHIGAIDERGVVGQCQTYANGNKAVIIEKAYWEESSDLKKEFIVFHELGHCILNRQHLDTASSDNNCNSIMNSGSAACKLDYTVENREMLLEELFTNL